MFPDCNLVDTSVHLSYNAKMANGASLPTNIQFTESTRIFKVTDDGKLLAGTYSLMITISANRGTEILSSKNVFQELLISENVPSTTNTIPEELKQSILLPSVYLKCPLGEQTKFVS